MKIRKGIAGVAIAIMPLTGVGIALTVASSNSGANAQTIAPNVSGSGGPTPTLTPTPTPTPRDTRNEGAAAFTAFANWLAYYIYVITGYREDPRPPLLEGGCCGIRG
jgi:hypothetical protein